MCCGPSDHLHTLSELCFSITEQGRGCCKDRYAPEIRTYASASAWFDCHLLSACLDSSPWSSLPLSIFSSHFVFRQALISTQHSAHCVFATAATPSPGGAQGVSKEDLLTVL